MANNPDVAIGDYVLIQHGLCPDVKISYRIVSVKDKNIYIETCSSDNNFILSPTQYGRNENGWSFIKYDQQKLQTIQDLKEYGGQNFAKVSVTFYQSSETSVDDVKNALIKYISDQENDESLPLRTFKTISGRRLDDRLDVRLGYKRNDQMKADKFLFIESKTLLGAILCYKDWCDRIFGFVEECIFSWKGLHPKYLNSNLPYKYLYDPDDRIEIKGQYQNLNDLVEDFIGDYFNIIMECPAHLMLRFSQLQLNSSSKSANKQW